MGKIGNEYYKLRLKDGRNKKYTPDTLADIFDEYSDFVHHNPFEEEQLFHYQGQITSGNAHKMRPMTLEGFCNYANITLPTFRDYASQKDFSSVTTRIREIIETHQLEGAASGFLNPNIIARKLGLVDKSDVTTGGQSMNPEEREKRIQELLRKAKSE